MTQVYLRPDGRLMLQEEIQKVEDFSGALVDCIQTARDGGEGPDDAPEILAQSGPSCHSELYGEPVFSADLPPGSFIAQWNEKTFRVTVELVEE